MVIKGKSNSLSAETSLANVALMVLANAVYQLMAAEVLRSDERLATVTDVTGPPRLSFVTSSRFCHYTWPAQCSSKPEDDLSLETRKRNGKKMVGVRTL